LSQISGPGISITFTATGQQVVEESRRVRVEVQQTAQAVSRSGEQMSAAQDRVEQSSARALQSMTRFARAALGGFGLLGLIGTVQSLADSFLRVQQTAEEAGAAIQRVGSESFERLRKIGSDQGDEVEKTIASIRAATAKEVAAIQQEAEKLREMLAFKGAGGGLFDFFGDVQKAVTGANEAFERQAAVAAARVESIRKQEAEAIRRLQEQAAQQELELRTRNVERIESEARAIRERGLSERERLEIETVRRLDELQAQLNSARTKRERDALLSLYGAVADEFNRRIMSIDEESSRRRREDAEREARQRADAERRAAEERARFEQSLAADAARRQEQIASSIESAARAMSDAARRLTETASDVTLIRGIVETRLAIGGGRR
jgi:hypothetical protein